VGPWARSTHFLGAFRQKVRQNPSIQLLARFLSHELSFLTMPAGIEWQLPLRRQLLQLVLLWSRVSLRFKYRCMPTIRPQWLCALQESPVLNQR
jgi:hypothetical protein